jgi:hypothetical protein
VADNLTHHLVPTTTIGGAATMCCAYCLRQPGPDPSWTDRTCSVRWAANGKPDHRAETDGQLDQGERCLVCGEPVVNTSEGYLHARAVTAEISRRLDLAQTVERVLGDRPIEAVASLAVAALRPVIVTLPDGQQTSVSRWAEDGTPHVMWRASRHDTWQPVAYVHHAGQLPAVPVPTYEERPS